ncbi:efflux RND transporter periplasmic adaptor subunit [Dysgonomonas sp. Marseille-P4361]|uniref:efflux RND transporter periplasmic adaptor subunit n=1 Tax=Dysgonomonas sp. Marseille-P4361 TaxID=2161820 RepID=UPI000D54F976|nr:hypothetical protein [Dysgonomonas sp. Marseille-P4361]
MIKHSQLLHILISIIFLSCSSKSDENIATYTVSSKNFENTIIIDGFVEPVRTTTLSCPRFVDGVVQFIIEDGNYVEEGEIVCIIEANELQTQYDQLVVNLENSRAQLNTTKATLSSEYAMLEAQVKSNEADAQIAQLDSLQLTYSPDNQRKIKELELEKVSIEKNKYEKKLKSLAIIQQSEIRKQEIEIQRNEQQANSIKERLDQLTIRAPKKGLATRAKSRMTGTKLKVGDNVWNNVPIIIMPEMEEVKIKIMAPEQDYKLINIGDSVQYTFDAIPDNIAWGKIKQRSPVGQPINRDSKVKLFEIEATVDSMITIPDPGFTANCQIWLKQITDTIVIPQIAVFEDDSIRVVYVKKNNKFEKRQVLTGLSSPKEAIITKGLLRGEVVSLTKPDPSSIKNTKLLPDSISKPPKKENQTTEKPSNS